MERSLISIIMPLYNAAVFLEIAVQSVLKQSYTQWELLIVNDVSTDDSLKIAEKFAEKDERIRLFSTEVNQGAAYCRNLATQNAKGDYIAFLDADDFWFPEKLLLQLRFMQKNACAVSFHDYVQVDEAGKSLGKRIKALPILPYKKQLKNNYIGNLTGMYNVKKLGKIEIKFLRKRQDWALWLEAIRRAKKPALGMSKSLAAYRITQSSLSANKWKLIRYNYLFYRDYLNYSTPKASIYFVQFLWEYFVIRPRQIEKEIENRKERKENSR